MSSHSSLSKVSLSRILHIFVVLDNCHRNIFKLYSIWSCIFFLLLLLLLHYVHCLKPSVSFEAVIFLCLIFSTLLTFAFNLSQRSLEWLQLNMLMIFQSSVERKQVAELKQWWEINITVLDSQRYMDQGIKNSLRCCADTALARHKRFVL